MTNDVRVWLYPGASPSDGPSGWESNYVDVSAYVRRPGQDGGAPITYSAGRQDESNAVDAGQMTLTLDNRDGRFSTDKIDGPYYGKLDTNTPIRMGTVGYADTFTRTSASGWGTANASLSQTWSHTGTSNFSVDGSKGQVIISAANTALLAVTVNGNMRDGDVTLTTVPAATATGGVYAQGPILRYVDTSNFVFCTLEFNTAGTVTIRIYKVIGGASTTLASLDPIPSSSYSAGNAWKIRAQADGDTIRAMAWPVSGSQPTAWQVEATQDTLTGSRIGVYSARFSGNTNSGASSLLGLDDFTAIGFEWTGTVVSWPVRWSITGGNSWAPITCAGVLRRLRQGTNPVESPLRHQLGGTADVTGYWPMEEGTDARYFLGSQSTFPAATFSDVRPGWDSTLDGGGLAPALSSDAGQITAIARTANNGTGFSAMFFVKLPSLPSSKTRIARIRTTRGPVPIWDLSIDGTNTYVEGINALGSVVTSSTTLIQENWTWWIAWQLETDNSVGGGNTGWSAIYHAIGSTNYWAQTGTVSGATNSNVGSITLSGANGTVFAHIWLGQNTLPFVTDTFSLVSSGYVGEAAEDRFARVASEAGIPYTIMELGFGSQAMGPQKEGSTLAILQSCADADFGVLAERGAGLEFIRREDRYNLSQTMAITVASGQVSDAPQPIRDDQRLRNKWTISRVNGGSGSYTDAASVLRNGTLEDSATLNVQDDSVLENQAGWRVALGISSKLRWPSITLDFARNPTLLPSWRKKTFGWRLGVTTGMTQVTGNEPDLIVEGYQCVLTPETWTAELNCTDAAIWTAAVTDDTGILGRVDTDGCTTTSLINSTATGSLPVTTIAGYPTWDSTAGLWSSGVDLNLGGERITVNAVTAAVGQAQTFTITARGVNGYAASHASGTSVSLWNPARVVL